MILLNPKTFEGKNLDAKTAEMMKNTIKFFEAKGKKKLKQDDRERVWYADFLDFVKKEKIFAKALTPAAYGDNNPEYRWDTYRNADFSEITGFYGLHYWYTWQVTILGLGPIWMGKNEAIKKKTAELLKGGSIFAFGLSEKAHGADLYSTEMSLTPQGNGEYKANGSKYYIGNANEAALVSTFGKIKDTGEFAFFAVGSQQKWYELVQNVVNVQSYVAEYALHDYPVGKEDILSMGQDAWDSALNTVNIGKFNLGWASIGISTHAFYEAINHASARILYGKPVTEFPHVKKFFVDAFCRLTAMKAFSKRAIDYMRSASSDDRRYLLFNPLVKMKVTTQGEQVIDLLWDIIAAKGFEKSTYFEMATRDIRALPKLEGTVHVNMALIIKFMKNYFFNPGKLKEIPQMSQPANDDFLFAQGETKGLGKIQFHDYNIAYNSVNLDNINVFKKQIQTFKEFLQISAMDQALANQQATDIDFLLSMGEIFSLVAYGQLIIEYRNLNPQDISDSLLNQIFNFMVRDVSKFALELYSKPNSSTKQMELCLKMIMKPITDEKQFQELCQNEVYSLCNTYTMNE